MRDRDLQALRNINADFKRKLKEIKAQQKETKELVKQTRAEVEEIRTEIVALQELHWHQMKIANPAINTAILRWTN